jgi:FkbH-like protein
VTSVVARWRELRAASGRDEISVRLLGTFTLDTFVPHLGVALTELGVPAEITVGPFNQIVRECLDPNSETAAKAPDVLVLWPRLEDLWGGPVAVPGTRVIRERLLRAVDDLIDAVGRRGGRHVVVLPSVPADRPLGAGDASSPHGVLALATAARQRLAEGLVATGGIVLCDAEDFVRAVGERSAYDRRLERLAAIPYTEGLFAEAGLAVARAIRLTVRSAVKAVVLDADGTLWGGVVGEIGAEGIELGPGPAASHLDFQRFLLGLRDNGVLLTLCSKNDEADVWKVFARPDMVMRREHLSAWRIGWRAKSVGVTQLAAELGIAVNDMVLVDDNPAELAEAEAALPALRTVLMPADPPLWRDAVADLAFDRLPPNDDDRYRPLRMAQDRERAQARRTLTPQDYLDHLGIWAAVKPASHADLPRMAQLVLRTNQMNLNGYRPSQDDLARLCTSRSHEVRLVEAGDRYGDYGQVGLFVLGFSGGEARLELFLLSCRALGRDVERMMLAEAFAVARARDCESIVAALEGLPRNEPARLLFGELGCAIASQEAVLTLVEYPSHVEVRRREPRGG